MRWSLLTLHGQLARLISGCVQLLFSVHQGKDEMSILVLLHLGGVVVGWFGPVGRKRRQGIGFVSTHTYLFHGTALHGLEVLKTAWCAVFRSVFRCKAAAVHLAVRSLVP